MGAYRTVIKDISAVLGDPAIDVAKLFFAVMIQSGLDRFGVADERRYRVDLALPPVKIHCSVLAEDAVKAAIADYMRKRDRSSAPLAG